MTPRRQRIEPSNELEQPVLGCMDVAAQRRDLIRERRELFVIHGASEFVGEEQLLIRWYQ
jgi:hypothetical protein